MDGLNNLLGEFHFIRPWWLLGLAVLAGITFLLQKHVPRNSIDDLVDPHLQAVVVDFPEQQRWTITRYLPVCLSGLLIFALAGPTWERLPQPLYQLQQGRVVVLSLAKSMDRTDIQPARLQRAQFEIEDLLTSMPGVLTGLVVFAGEAFVVAPLSDDQDTISNLLQSLDSDTLPVQGNRADRGLEKARELLSQVSIDSGEIILVTDQASPLAVSTARELSNNAMRVSVLEIAPRSDRSQSALLESIALSGRGVYVRLSPGDLDIEQLNAPLRKWLIQAQSETSESQRRADQWRDMGPWLLLPIILLASLMFRQGWLLNFTPVAMWMGLLSAPQPANAFDWQSLWQRHDQQQWTAAQAYRKNDMPAALNGFARDKTATGAYNRGNALANSGQLEAALEAYDEALELEADFEDAKYNRSIVEAALAQQQNQQSQPGQNQEMSEQKDASGEKQDEESEQQDQQKQGDKPLDQKTRQGSGQPDKPEEAGPAEKEIEAEQPQEQGKQAQHRPPENPAPEDKQAAMLEESGPVNEDAQALELLLRQVPDDPGALLRRKFKHQYQIQNQQQ